LLIESNLDEKNRVAQIWVFYERWSQLAL